MCQFCVLSSLSVSALLCPSRRPPERPSCSLPTPPGGIPPEVAAGIPQVMAMLVPQWAAGRLGSLLGGFPAHVHGKLKARADFLVNSETNFGDRKGTALDQQQQISTCKTFLCSLCAFSFTEMIAAALYCTWEGSLSAVKQFPEACCDCPRAQMAPLCHIHPAGGSGCVGSGNKCGGLVLAGAFTVAFEASRCFQ